MLKDTPVSPDFPFQTLAEVSDGLSGSDLKELCRNAAMVPMRELMRRAGDNKAELFRMREEVRHQLSLCRAGANVLQGFELRPLALEDFFQADGTSALPPREATLEEVLEKLAS